MDLFRGGRFSRADAAATTQLFIILAVTLALWAVQGIYARAFYAASDTKTPAITGTLITVALRSRCTAALFHALGLRGLAIASDIGIFVQTASLAILLHRKRLVSLAHLEFGELGPRPVRRSARLSSPPPPPRTSCRPSPPTATTSSPSPPPPSSGSPPPASLSLATGSKLPAQILRRR